MQDIGLDALTDDQLVELASALAAEMLRRNPAVLDAAKKAIMDATTQAVNAQDTIWARKRWLARMVTEIVGGTGWIINVWRARDRDEVRVYLETPGVDRRGRGNLKYCYYVTGGRDRPPGALTLESGRDATKADAETIRIIARQVYAVFPDGVRIDCDAAAATTYEDMPIPAELADRLAAMARERAEEEARDRWRATVFTREQAVAESERAAYYQALGLEIETTPSLNHVDAVSAIWRRRQERVNRAMAEYEASKGNAE